MKKANFTPRKAMRRVLLTGGSRGIGRAIKEKLSYDFEVIAPSREELDLLDNASIDRFMVRNREFDILINNAGINIIKPLQDISDLDIRNINTVNLESPLKLIRECVPHMKEQNYGRIVNLSSIWGVRSKELRTLYSGTKFGLIGQTKALARELGEHNILLNAVCPGFTNTELTSASLSKQQRDDMESEIPVKRFAQPDEIAELVAFLVGNLNTYVTGQAIVIDGGFTA
jgi:NAD(P)-dependent dehydrogenase (short-subunit alcohol dehydrogenase family)